MISLNDEALEQEIKSFSALSGEREKTVTRRAIKEYLKNHKAYWLAVKAKQETTSYISLDEWAKKRGLAG